MDGRDHEALHLLAGHYRITPAHVVAFVGSGIGSFALLLWTKIRHPRHLKD